MSSRGFTKIVALLVVCSLIIPAAALAQSSQDSYSGPNVLGLTEGNGPSNDSSPSGDTSPTSASGNTTPVAKASGSTLPFTGADLGVLAVAGGALMALGFGLRRLTSTPTRA